MKTIIIFISGLVSGYVISNLKYKDFGEIIEDISSTVQSWLETTKNFIGETAKEIEGFDSDQIQMNIEAFINALSEGAEKFTSLNTMEEKINFIEDEIAKVTKKLVKKTGK